MALEFATTRGIEMPVVLQTTVELEAPTTLEKDAIVNSSFNIPKKQVQTSTGQQSQNLPNHRRAEQILSKLPGNPQEQATNISSYSKPVNENIQIPLGMDANRNQNTLSLGAELPSYKAEYLNNPKPRYPTTSLRLEEQGRVVVRVFIGKDGVPQKIEIGSSSGFIRLDRAALEAVKEWKFVPGTRAGLPEAMWIDVPLVFKIN